MGASTRKSGSGRSSTDGGSGVREGLEEKTRKMAEAAAALIAERVRYADGSPVECVIADESIGGCAEAARAAEQFSRENVIATLSVTPCWCYGSETMDMDPTTIKAVWGFNGTERPGAVYLAAVMAAHAQRACRRIRSTGTTCRTLRTTPSRRTWRRKSVRFAKCAAAVGQMRGKSYVNVGGVSMGIMGSYCDADFFQKYLGIRAEWVDMTEVLRRVEAGIYDHEEYEKALAWVKAGWQEGLDKTPPSCSIRRRRRPRNWSSR